MTTKLRVSVLALVLFLTAAAAERTGLVGEPKSGAPQGAGQKFNEAREIAPGVFFYYSSISATDKNVPFGGSNHVWVVFEDYVVVFDANFPKEAGEVIKAIRKTTQKPIRYVL